MTNVPTQPAAGLGKRAVGPCQADGELIALVSHFLAEGIRSGDGIVVVTRAAHRDRGHVTTLAIELEALRGGIGALLPFAVLSGYPADAPVGRGTADDVRTMCRLWSDAVIVTRAFPPGLDSVRAARHFAARLLGPECDRELAQDAAIVVTELTANAVLHAGSGFTLAIGQSATSARIAVRDGRPLAPRSDGRPFDVTAGHGLSVVAGLASEWAATPLPDGKVVWADLAVSRGDARAAARADG